MKQNWKFFFLISILSTFSLVAILSFHVGEHKEKPLTLAMMTSIQLPESVTLFDTVIPITDVEIYERLDRELTSFTYQHGNTLLSIKRANRYFPIIEPILKSQGIPVDFKYLAVVESMLDEKAFSSAKAAGIWQFLDVTGRQYGLEITSQVDERYHVKKATIAACRYLKDAYKKYGDWILVAAAYNAGQNRISTELEKQKGKVFFDLWLNEETTRYIYRIMAIKEIFEQPYHYGFVLRSEHLYPPMRYKEITVTKTIPDLAQFAREQGYTYAQLKRSNIWLRDRKLTVVDGKEYQIRFPEKEMLYRVPSTKVMIYDKRWVED